jgi:hypothetical protein
MLALAPDCLAQLMRAWPDADGPTDLVQAMAVFSDASLPVAVRCAFDHDFTGAHRAAKRARGADGMPHPVPHATPMDAVLATPPRAILRQAVATAAAASTRVDAAERTLADHGAEIAALRNALATAEPAAAAAIRRELAIMEGRFAQGSNALRDDFALLRGGVRDEVAALRREVAEAAPSAMAAVATGLSAAEHRLRAQEARSLAADARVAEAERALLAQREDVDALRRAAACADPQVAATVQREIAALEARIAPAGADSAALRGQMSALEARLAHEAASMREDVVALRRAMQTAAPADTAGISMALQRAEQRFREHEELVLASNARVTAAERALSQQRAEIEALRRALSSTVEPTANAAIAQLLADAEQRWREAAAKALHTEERTHHAIGEAERRIHDQERWASAADARATATEQALRTQREEIEELRRQAAAHRVELARMQLRRDDRPRDDPAPNPPRSHAPPFEKEPTISSATADDDDDDSDFDPPSPRRRHASRSRSTGRDVGIDKIEFYLRGPRAIQFWASHGIGVRQHLTELFKIYWHRFIVGRLSGSDAAQAASTMDALLLACRDYRRGGMARDTARALSDSVTFITSKAGYGAHKATVICDLYRQDRLDPDFKRVVQAAATIVDRDVARPSAAATSYVKTRVTRPIADAREHSHTRKQSPSQHPNDRTATRAPARERGGRGRGGRGRGPPTRSASASARPQAS